MPHARTPSEEVRKEFGRRLAAWRKSHMPAVTQAEAADWLNVKPKIVERTWSRWEQGATAPSGANLRAVIELTGIDVSDLGGLSQVPPAPTASRKWLEEQFRELHRKLDELARRLDEGASSP